MTTPPQAPDVDGRDPLTRLLAPRSVAVIGASADPAKVGGRPLHFLARAGFGGAVYPVNPRAAEVQGRPAYPDVAALPELVDVALVAVAAAHVPQVVADCSARGVGALVVFSGGFAENGAAGRAGQVALRDTVRAAGARLLGPNTLGVFTPAIGWYGTFATALDATPGRSGVIGVVTQSGAVGSYLYAMLHERGTGVSSFVATGNEADVTLADAVLALVADPATEVIAITLDHVVDGRAFVAALAAAAAAGKPVVGLTMGRSEVGARAAASHTGALAGDHTLLDAVARQYGVELVGSLSELADVAVALSIGPRPRSNRTVVVTTSGGVGVLVADELTAGRLELPPLAESVRQRITEVLPLASGSNPLDTSTQILADFTLLSRALDIVLAGGRFDVVVLFLAHIGRNPAHWTALRDSLFDVRARHPDALFAIAMLTDDKQRADLRRHRFLNFADPSEAARVVGRLALSHPVAAPAPARTPLDAAAELRGRTFDEVTAGELLRAAGVPVLPAQRATTADDAVRAAREIGYPVVVKGIALGITHKSDHGLVRVGLMTDAQVLAACVAMQTIGLHVTGFAVAPMAEPGVEAVIGVHNDPVFGPVLMVGRGGTAIETERDVSFAHAPINHAQADELIGSTGLSGELRAARGRPHRDRSAVAAALVRLGEFAVAHADGIESIEVNPLLVTEHGAVGLDAVVLTRPAPSEKQRP